MVRRLFRSPGSQDGHVTTHGFDLVVGLSRYAERLPPR